MSNYDITVLAISNNIKNIHKVDATIIKANNVVRRVILVLKETHSI